MAEIAGFQQVAVAGVQAGAVKPIQRQAQVIAILCHFTDAGRQAQPILLETTLCFTAGAELQLGDSDLFF